MQTIVEIKCWFKTSGIPPTPENITQEQRIQALEDDGLTRSDAQGVDRDLYWEVRPAREVENIVKARAVAGQRGGRHNDHLLKIA